METFLNVDTLDVCPVELGNGSYAVRAMGAVAIDEIVRADFILERETMRTLADVVHEADTLVGAPIGTFSLIRACGLHPETSPMLFELVGTVILQKSSRLAQYTIATSRRGRPKVREGKNGIGVAELPSFGNQLVRVGFVPHDPEHLPHTVTQARSRGLLEMYVAGIGIEKHVRSMAELKGLG